MQTERKFCGYTWKDMNRVLDTVCEVEDRAGLEGQERKDYDIAVQCVAAVLNRMLDDRPLCWDEEAGE